MHALLPIMLATGCVTIPPMQPTGDGGTGGDGANPDGNTDAPPGLTCASVSSVIYTIDAAARLDRFDPATKTFTFVAAVACPGVGAALPFSLAVSRTFDGWLLYDSGDLFRIDLATGACTATTWVGPTSFKQFAMSFSTDTAGGSTETMFVAGGPIMSMPSGVTFATLNTSTMMHTPLTTISGSPELAGTRNAELFGFFPHGVPTISKLDRANGATSSTLNLASLIGTPTAWTFAIWGGEFWVFLKKNSETESTIYQINGAGTILGMTSAGGRSIIGAATSTCTP